MDVPNKLQIVVVEARNLMAADLNGKSDPYVKIKDVPGLGGKGAKTNWKKATLSPTWNETFNFTFNYKTVTLRFKIFDHDAIGKDDEIGKCFFPMAQLMDGQPKDLWLPVFVNKKMKGELHLRLQAQWLIPIFQVGQWVQIRTPQCGVGLGWDFSKKKPAVDLDASVLALTTENKIEATVSFRSLVAFGGAIQHTGDNRTGQGSGDDERINFDLMRIPPQVAKIVVTVHSFSGQSLTSAKSAYLRLFDAAGSAGFYRPTQMVNGTGMLFGLMMRNPANGYWFFQIICQPIRGKTVQDSVPDIASLLGGCHF